MQIFTKYRMIILRYFKAERKLSVVNTVTGWVFKIFLRTFLSYHKTSLFEGYRNFHRKIVVRSFVNTHTDWLSTWLFIYKYS